MKRIIHVRPKPDNELLHIETPLGIVNIKVGLRDQYGRRVDSIEVIPSQGDSAGSMGEVHRIGYGNTRLIEAKEGAPPLDFPNLGSLQADGFALWRDGLSGEQLYEWHGRYFTVMDGRRTIEEIHLRPDQGAPSQPGMREPHVWQRRNTAGGASIWSCLHCGGSAATDAEKEAAGHETCERRNSMPDFGDLRREGRCLVELSPGKGLRSPVLLYQWRGRVFKVDNNQTRDKAIQEL